MRAQIEEGDVELVLHVLVGGDQVAGLQIVRPQPEDPRAHLGQVGNRGNARVANQAPVLACLEQGLHDQIRQGGLVRALQHGHGLLARNGCDQIPFREGLQELDRDHADPLTLAAQVGGNRLGVVGHGSQADDHMLGILCSIGLDR